MTKVLAVDDSGSMRQMVEYALSNEGYEVETAVDGMDALSKAKRSNFDLVLTDINMPKMDGFELIKSLREMQNYKYTPILTLTTESGDDKKRKGKEAGATGWIVKPFTPDKLISTIRKVCR